VKSLWRCAFVLCILVTASLLLAACNGGGETATPTAALPSPTPALETATVGAATSTPSPPATATVVASPTPALGTPTVGAATSTPSPSATATVVAAPTPFTWAVDPCTLRTSLEGRPLAEGPSFALDASTEWQLCLGGAAAGSSEKYLFHTTDGGEAWTLISRTTLGNPPPEAGVGDLPNGNAVVQILFLDAAHGWMGLNSSGVNLFRSQDGGVTWAEVAVIPQGVPVTSISFSDAMNGTVVTPEGTWTTSDGGVTWTHLSLRGEGDESEDFATQIYRYEPSVPDDVLPRDDANYCWTSSFSSRRSDAFRCALENFVSYARVCDPCFSIASMEIMVCPGDPRTDSDDIAFTFDASAILPNLYPQDNVWFMVVSEMDCRGVSGSLPDIMGKRYDFNCSQTYCTKPVQGPQGFVCDCLDPDTGRDKQYTVDAVWY